MNKQNDFVYKAVLQGCRQAGLSEYAATEQANTALTMYKRNQFSGKPIDLINSQIQLAKKTNKKEKGAKR